MVAVRSLAPAPRADPAVTELRTKLRRSTEVRRGGAKIATREGHLVVELSGGHFLDRAVAIAKELAESGTEVAYLSIGIGTGVSQRHETKRHGRGGKHLIEILFVR
jgi:hypothetical protein